MVLVDFEKGFEIASAVEEEEAAIEEKKI